MTTIITLPRHLAEQLESYASARQRSAEALAIEFIEAALVEHEEETLEELVARIKKMPRSPQNENIRQGNLAEVLRALEAMDYEVDIDAQNAAFRAAEEELRAMNRADDIAEGRG